MNRFTFGRAIDLRLTLLEGGETGVVPFSLVSARLYADKPTNAQVADVGSATTGHIERVTTWTTVNFEGTSRSEQRLLFAPVADPAPTASKAQVETYYVAVNFKYSQAGETVSTVEVVYLHRPDATTGKIRVTADDVVALDSSIGDFAPTPLWIEDKVNAAVQDVESRLEGRGYQKARVGDWQKLDACASRLAVFYCCLDLAKDGNQTWLTKADIWKGMSDSMFEAAKISYDFSGDDEPAPDSQVTTGAVAFIR